MLDSIKSYQYRLFVVFFVSIAPFIIFNIYKLSEMREQTIEQSIHHAQTLTQSIHKTHLVLIETVKREMAMISHFPAILNAEIPVCDTYLKDILQHTRFYTNIALADQDSRVICSAKEGLSHVSKMAHPVFLKAQATGTFSLGDGAISDNHGLPIIPFAYPLTNHTPLPNAVLMAGVSLRWLNETSFDVNQMPHMRILVISSKDTIIGTVPFEDEWLGQKLPSDATPPKSNQESTLETEDAYWVYKNSAHGMRIIIRIDKNTLISSSNTLIYQSLMIIAVMLLFTTLISRWVSERLIIKELERLLKALLQKTRHTFMSELLNNISHHWKNPLNAISIQLSNFQDQLQTDSLDKTKTLQNLEQSHKLINNMSSTINYFSDMFQTEEVKTQFRLLDAVNMAHDLLCPRFQDENIIFETYKVDEEIVLTAYKNEMIRILTRLLNNAIDSIAKTDKTLRKVEVQTQQTTDDILILIKDSGCGIDKQIEATMFEPYTSTKFAASGTGLSLFMVKSLLEQSFSGTIQAKSSADGCLVSIRLPRKINEQA